MANSLTFSATAQSGDKLNKSVTDINVNAAGTVLHEFARRANAMTTNTLGNVNRISKVNLDGEKLTPTLTISPASITTAQLQTALSSAPYHYIANVTYDGDGELGWTVGCDSPSDSNFSAGKFVRDDGIKFWVGSVTGQAGAKRTFTITAAATDNFNAASATLTITD